MIVESARGGDASLLHRDRSQRGKANHIAYCKDVLHLGLEVLIDRNAPAIVGFEAGGGQIQVVDVALAAHGIKQSVAGDALLALQIGDHRRRRRSSSTLSTSSPSRMVTRLSRR